ncbi:MAG: FAD-dependent oxidoreductase [Protaetiibacter sp.]
MTAASEGIVIVGAGIAGFTLAESLRAEGMEAPITVIGEETHPPYLRPPLSKQVMSGAWTLEQTAIADRDSWDRLGVRFLAGTRATSVDGTARVIRTDDADVPFGILVIATGVHPRPLGVPGGDAAIGLRNRDDAEALLASLVTARRVVVIGTGVLGCELAASIRMLGKQVALVGRHATAAFGGLGPWIGERVIRTLREGGVEVHLGKRCERILRDGQAARTAVLDDGTRLEAELVIAAIGSSPAVDWLIGSGLELDLSDGVLCDETGRAAPGVYAVGDVARWASGPGSLSRRHEHQSTAVEQAHAVARAITHDGAHTTEPIVAGFSSELFAERITVAGDFPPDAPAELASGDPASGRFVLHLRRGATLDGAIAWNSPRELRASRLTLLTQASRRKTSA